MRLMQWPNACTGSFAAGWTALILLNVCFLTSNSACSVTVVGRIETLGTENRARALRRTTQANVSQRKVERAMGIEPTREARPRL
jgi:hypothetical protein